MAGNLTGVAYNRPYRPYSCDGNKEGAHHRIWEFPTTGPQDVQLIEDLRVDEDNLLRIWSYKAEFCKDFGGTFVLHTHPIHVVKRLGAYVEFIKVLNQKGFENLTMKEAVNKLECDLSHHPSSG
jgi:hypothetical protein